MSDHRFNPALTGDALRRAAAAPAIGQRPTVKVMIEFDPATGECQLVAPNSPALFYGILKLAEKAFDRMQAQPAPAPDDKPPDGGKPQ